MRRSSVVLFLAVIGALLLCAAPRARAQYEHAPIQIEVRSGKLLTMYDCWPGTDSGEMTVYVWAHDGLATYTCAFDGGAWVSPLWSMGDYELLGRRG